MEQDKFKRAVEIAETLDTLNGLQSRIADFRTFIPYDHYSDAQWHNILHFLSRLPKPYYTAIMVAVKSGLYKLENGNKEDIERLRKEIDEL